MKWQVGSFVSKQPTFCYRWVQRLLIKTPNEAVFLVPQLEAKKFEWGLCACFWYNALFFLIRKHSGNNSSKCLKVFEGCNYYLMIHFRDVRIVEREERNEIFYALLCHVISVFQHQKVRQCSDGMIGEQKESETCNKVLNPPVAEPLRQHKKGSQYIPKLIMPHTL